MILLFIWISMISRVLGEIYLDEEVPFQQPIFRDWENFHGYVQVRPGAHMFYWLFYADGTKVDAVEKPLVIWIQGGPGFAASGVGNFGEIGPLNMDFKPRNHTWVKGRNLLFIDHPVGTGFSYVTNSSLYVKTDRDLAMDLSKAIKVFFRRHKNFRKTPAYLFGQSYGGKACPRLGFYLHTAIQRKSLQMNFKGIGIGGGWVDPKESTAVQTKFLYYTGAIDRNQYLSSSQVAKKLIRSLLKNDYSTANELDTVLFHSLNNERFINFNNVYGQSPYPALERLNTKVNMYLKPTLAGVNQSRTWQYLSTTVYENLKESFLLSSTSFLEALLDNTKLKIAIYNGNLDVVTPLAGACNWVHKLKWSGAHQFTNAKRIPINGENNGYFKKAKNLSFWWVFRAGHWMSSAFPNWTSISIGLVPGWYYPRTETQRKMTALVLSYFVGECETGGPTMQKHHKAAMVWLTMLHCCIVCVAMSMIPEENPEAMEQILQHVMSGF